MGIDIDVNELYGKCVRILASSNQVMSHLPRLYILFLLTLVVIGVNLYFYEICDFFSMVEGYQCPNKNQAISDTAITLVYCLIPGFFIRYKIFRPSDLLILLVYLMHYLGIIITYPNLNIAQFDWWRPIVCLSFTLVIIVNNIKFSYLNIRFKPVKKLSIGLSFFILFIFYFGCVLLIFRENGLNLSPPNITDVYGVREAFVNNSSLLGGYVSVISGYVLSPFMMVLALLFWNRDKVGKAAMVFIASIFLSFVIYSATGFKSVAFSSFTVILFYIFLKTKDFYAIKILSLLAITIYTFYLALPFSLINIVALHWIRRVFIVPGMNVNYFFDYFVNNNSEGWSNAPFIVSEIYYGTSGSANAGLIGDGLARAGWLGLVFNMFLFFLTLKFVDIFKTEKNKYLYGAMISTVGYALSNSSITTIFLTYGLFFIIILFIVFDRFLEKYA
ncbi:hypothetical protein G7045_00410 [Acidovorax sp. HDW3]|uniref:hypothetical protein n=1 Tax=Acidovorax sp. HDW3 TaxID=2714923 RepID=UPI00140D0DE8|nr:hypothetical protein [Acidovorax sp. HDW3]QIL42838.1 hypothetical protein G7045_00410 [Acidovorax sp. HDW3]